MNASDSVTTAVVDQMERIFDECLDVIRHCVGRLSDEQVWWRPLPAMNSIGNLLLHLEGNVRQWVISGVGDADDNRDRPSEFAQREPLVAAELLGKLEAVVGEAMVVLRKATAESLTAARRVQGFEVNGWHASLDSLVHFKGHTQEIVSMTRMQLGDRYKFRWQPQTVEEGAPRE